MMFNSAHSPVSEPNYNLGDISLCLSKHILLFKSEGKNYLKGYNQIILSWEATVDGLRDFQMAEDQISLDLRAPQSLAP